MRRQLGLDQHGQRFRQLTLGSFQMKSTRGVGSELAHDTGLAELVKMLHVSMRITFRPFDRLKLPHLLPRMVPTLDMSAVNEDHAYPRDAAERGREFLGVRRRGSGCRPSGRELLRQNLFLAG